MNSSELRKRAAGPAGPDCYALLGLDTRYAVDLAELERHYLERSRAVHPDRFVGAPAAERVRALDQSMQLNQAYKTLRSPVSRAEYLLGLHGVAIGDNETLSPDFLMEFLELREELSEARHAGDRVTLRRLESAMLDRRDRAVARLGELFAGLEERGDRTILAEIKAELILLRYIGRYLEALDDEEGEP